MRNHWSEQQIPESEESAPRERNPDSSLQSEYEDTVLPDVEWQHESDS